MDGTSGALYAIFLNSLTHYFQLHLKTKDVDLKIWTEALDSSLSALSTYTPARTGDRTLMDALIPFVATLKNTERLETAVKAAEVGALNTKFMHPALGRTVYVGSEAKWMGKIPDPGAWGLYRFLEGLVKD
jgi:dihydroxyacetone kinase